MTNPVPLIARLKIISSTLFWAFLLIIFMIGLPILLQASTKLAAGFAATALVLAIIVTWLLRTISYTQSTRPVFFVMVKPFLFLLFFLVGISTLPIYYLGWKSETRPLFLPQTEISNGEKTLVFQGMLHIGDTLFFNSINHKLEHALQKEHKVFYEQVKASTPENDAWFTKATSFYDTSKHYQDIANACGIQFQPDYAQLPGHKNAQESGQAVAIDLDTAQLKTEYDRLIRDDNAFNFSMSLSQHADKTQTLQKHLAALIQLIDKHIERPQQITRALCHGFFSLTLDPARKIDSPMDKIMIDLRNKHIASMILTDTNNTIYALYNPMHLTGVLKELRNTDSRWEIKSTTWLRCLTP